MDRGKSICRVLKDIRRQVAEANDIDLYQKECTYEGPCRGTCPACEAEVRFIDRQLDLRRKAGQVVRVAGVSMGVMALAACGGHPSQSSNDAEVLMGDVPAEVVENVAAEPKTQVQPQKQPQQPCEGKTSKAEIVVETGEVVDEPADTLVDAKHNMVFGEIVEQMPSFPGGQNALKAFIQENTQRPEELLDDSVQGRVIVSFVVDRDGSVVDPKVVKSVHPLLDEEALRVVRMMPKWVPGRLGGETTRVMYNLPFEFKKNEIVQLSESNG